MSDEGQRAQKTTAELDRMVIARQPDRSELDEAIAWRDRFIAWQTDRMRGDACTDEQIEAMVRKALDMPYAFWIRAMPRRAGRLARGEARLHAVGVRLHRQAPEDLQGLVQVRDGGLGLAGVQLASADAFKREGLIVGLPGLSG